jgi:hypothetical protein
MARKCYISFKTEDIDYKRHVQRNAGVSMIDKSLNEAIQSSNEDYILRKLREDYLADSTVTIHLIGEYGAENRGSYEQRFIKRELQASLYDGVGNSRNGILGIVLPTMTDRVYRGTNACSVCGNSHNVVAIDDTTVVSEFSYNYYIPIGKCAHGDDDRYCLLVQWDTFLYAPETFIEQAFNKRSSSIAQKVRVYGRPD